MVSRNLKAIAVIVGIFLSGAGTGSVVTYVWSRNRLMSMLDQSGPFRHEMRMRALQRTLQLSTEQRAAISAILEREEPTRRRLMGEVMQTCGEPIRAHKTRIDAEIRALLRADQRARFDELAAQQSERFSLGPPHKQ